MLDVILGKLRLRGSFLVDLAMFFIGRKCYWSFSGAEVSSFFLQRARGRFLLAFHSMIGWWWYSFGWQVERMSSSAIICSWTQALRTLQAESSSIFQKGTNFDFCWLYCSTRCTFDWRFGGAYASELSARWISSLSLDPESPLGFTGSSLYSSIMRLGL